jgi:hypothetical protein
MKKLAIMQPYFFPYLGYWQLINEVDTFVIYDNVNYIKQGWINRNKILMNGQEHFLTLSLKKASSFKFINQIEILDNRKKLLKTIIQAYKKATCYNQFLPMIEDIFSVPETNLARFLIYSIKKIIAYLGIRTEIIISSEMKPNEHLNGEERVLDICRQLNCSKYINAISGRELYSAERFRGYGIDLAFLKCKEVEYRHFDNEFIPNLSIIDILAFNNLEKIGHFLKEFNLIE